AQHQRDEQPEDRMEIDALKIDLAGLGRSRQRLALYQLHQRVAARRDAAVEIAPLEPRREDVAPRALRHRIRNGALEAAPHLDAQLTVVLRDDEDHAVVDARSPDLPRLGEADRELLYGLRLGGWKDQDRDLAAFRLLKVAQPRL